MSETLPLDQVRVNGRHRQDLGDLTSLVESIDRDGLFHPIVVTGDGELLAGHRRLEAVRSLGWDDVPVTRAKTLGDAAQRLRVERDENTCRLDMAPSEKGRLGMELEKLERPKAAERVRQAQETSGKRKGSGNLPEPFAQKGQTRDIVAGALDWSGSTYDRAKRVIEAADSGDPVARAALVEMDRTGRVNPAYRKITNKPLPPPKPFHASPGRNRNVAEKAKGRIEKAVGAANGMARGLDRLRVDQALAVADPEEVDGWDQVFKEASAAIGRLRKRLKEPS